MLLGNRSINMWGMLKMKFKFRVNSGVWFTPNVEFVSEWAAWLYIKDLFGDAEIKNYQIEEILPETLKEQAL